MNETKNIDSLLFVPKNSFSEMVINGIPISGYYFGTDRDDRPAFYLPALPENAGKGLFRGAEAEVLIRMSPSPLFFQGRIHRIEKTPAEKMFLVIYISKETRELLKKQTRECVRVPLCIWCETGILKPELLRPGRNLPEPNPSEIIVCRGKDLSVLGIRLAFPGVKPEDLPLSEGKLIFLRMNLSGINDKWDDGFLIPGIVKWCRTKELDGEFLLQMKISGSEPAVPSRECLQAGIAFDRERTNNAPKIERMLAHAVMKRQLEIIRETKEQEENSPCC